MGECAVMLPRNLSEFLHAVTSFDSDVTKKESERFNELTEEAQEIILTTGMRLRTRIESLDKAQRDHSRFEQEFFGSILENAEDPDDDFETGYAKKMRSQYIEKEYNGACIRLNFELRDSAKCSIYK